MPTNPLEIYTARKSYIHLCCSFVGGIKVHKELNIPIANDQVYLPMNWRYEPKASLQLSGFFVSGDLLNHFRVGRAVNGDPRLPGIHQSEGF